jgi:protoporphyrinogen oxidase
LNLLTFFKEALGGSRKKTEHLDGTFYYPRLGIGTIMDRLAEACGAERVHTNSRITRAVHDGRRITQLEINGKERLSADSVISTLPLNILLSILDPKPRPEIVSLARSIRFQNILLVVLFLNCPQVTRNASLYFPDKGIPITRTYEPKNRSAAMSPCDKTSLVVEIPTRPDSPNWAASDELLIETAKEVIVSKHLARAEDVFDAAVYRIPFAYPVLELGYEKVVAALTDYLSRFENLHMTGRSAKFAYLHIHDLLHEGRQVASEVLRESTVDSMEPA